MSGGCRCRSLTPPSEKLTELLFATGERVERREEKEENGRKGRKKNNFSRK